jgi:hypothetical protein
MKRRDVRVGMLDSPASIHQPGLRARHQIVIRQHDLFRKPVPTPRAKCGAGIFGHVLLQAQRHEAQFAVTTGYQQQC